jgi:hypothetical protein
MYTPDPDEVFFCGKCRRQQEPEKGEKCIICGKQTISWFTNRELSDVAMKRWEWLHGK